MPDNIGKMSYYNVTKHIGVGYPTNDSYGCPANTILVNTDNYLVGSSGKALIENCFEWEWLFLLKIAVLDHVYKLENSERAHRRNHVALLYVTHLLHVPGPEVASPIHRRSLYQFFQHFGV